ncbi:hypothetical protein [Devosia ginsengisoli]|uniref:Uncharacterized protein n=1 Tax=Devosia ginsengisoli TaxID=400770 RepID=A0A5B8LRH9_9HYPH|nr:hypothetical protein [Devosia ginsengisoli]QDZ10706.1 hypothetical protein FPZ08_08040 [Devosia ginsengisoli]
MLYFLDDRLDPARMKHIQLFKTAILASICLLGLATAATGAWATYRELQPQELGSTALDRVLAMRDGTELSAFSIASQNNALLDCTNALGATQSLAMMYGGTEARRQIAPKCLALADHVARQTPSNAFAWYVGAEASAALQYWDGLNRRLALSWRTGPTEQWVGELRVALAEDNYQHLDDQVIAANDADLHMLVRSARGVRAIAARYVTDPGFRERITAIVETMPTENQARFLANVRRFAVTRAQS